jgi:hypothetical protein
MRHSIIDWNRHNTARVQWPDKDFDWSERTTVPKDLGPHAHKKALMVLLSPLFAGAAMYAAVAIDNPGKIRSAPDPAYASAFGPPSGPNAP